MKEELWLSTDDVIELKSCLKTIKRELPLVTEDINVWKIIIMLQHNAQQAAMVRVLRQGNITNIMDKKSKEKYLQYIAGDLEDYNPGKYKLLTFNELYRRLKSPKYMKNNPFRSNMNSDMQMARLNDFRNEFIHFLSSGWSIHVSAFPKIVEESNRIITELFGEWRFMLLISEKNRLEILALIKEINKINQAIGHDYIV